MRMRAAVVVVYRIVLFLGWAVSRRPPMGASAPWDKQTRQGEPKSVKRISGHITQGRRIERTCAAGILQVRQKSQRTDECQ